MPRTLVRLLATLVLAVCAVVAAGLTPLAAGPDNTWAAAGALAENPSGPIFALAVDPADGRRTLAGTAGGAIYLNPDGGTGWRTVRKSTGHAVLALAFDPARPGTLLAGTRGTGIWRSNDGGQTWQSQPGSDGKTVRAFAFLNGAVLAASDEGVLSSRDGGSWSSAGLPQVHVSALTVLPGSGGAANGTVIAGGDATQGNEPLPLFSSADGGRTWTAVPVAGQGGVVGGSSMVAALASGPAPRQGARPLLIGTNTGLFMTRDQGASWQQLTGGGALPATDVSSLAVAPRRGDRLYAASDGGGSTQGGLWVSSDAGDHCASMAPPVPGVTALAVSGEDTPTLVVATFRAADHAVALWRYRDGGGQPRAPAAAAPSPGTARPARDAPAGAGGSRWTDLLTQPETPYLVIGAAALGLVVLAAVVYLRRGRQPP
jgi:photosystem II stability/assembly factor-like uncharacterized protein